MSSSGNNLTQGPGAFPHHGSRVRVLSLFIGLVIGIVAGVWALSGTVEAEEYSAYSDPEKPVISYLLSNERNVKDFKAKFGLSGEEMEKVLAAGRAENKALATEYAESEEIVESSRELSAEEVQEKIAASDYDETVRAAVARTKATLESILPEDRRAELEGWVDERWARESQEAAFSAESGSYEFSATGIRCRVFATQYIGYTRYEVALPHRRLKFDGGFRVRIKRPNRTGITAPVKEVGPWNTYDNYWMPRRYRTMWKDLPRCRPEAQAAFYQNYNRGEDEQGREVLNPAGVDLTPAVAARLGLKKYQNAWVYVRFPWVRK